MDDLSPLRPVLVMLMFWFIMGVIRRVMRMDSDCKELSLTEGILPRGGVMRPSLIEDISERQTVSKLSGVLFDVISEKSDVFAPTGFVSGVSYIILVDHGSRYIPKILRIVHASEI